MIRINESKCTGCGECSRDCSYGAISIVDGKAVYDGQKCNRCAHCVAICPTKAIDMPSYEGMEIFEKEELDTNVSSEHLLDLLRYRRSIRRFTKDKVEENKLKMIIEAARYTQSGGNAQAGRYIIIDKERSKITRMALDGLLTKADLIEKHPEKFHPREQRFARLWREFDKAFTASGGTEDVLFFGSPTQILIISDTNFNAGLAAQSMNIMAVTQGLGVLFCGYCQMGVEYNPELQKYFELGEHEAVYGCMCIGYQVPNYMRTAPRNEVKVTVL